MNVAPKSEPPLPALSFRRAGGLTGVATVLFLFGLGLMFRDLTTSNRPHELTSAPWVAAILLVNAVICYRILRHLWLGRRGPGSGSKRPWYYLLVVFVLCLASANLFVLLGALGTVPDVMGWR